MPVSDQSKHLRICSTRCQTDGHETWRRPEILMESTKGLFINITKFYLCISGEDLKLNYMLLCILYILIDFSSPFCNLPSLPWMDIKANFEMKLSDYREISRYGIADILVSEGKEFLINNFVRPAANIFVSRDKPSPTCFTAVISHTRLGRLNPVSNVELYMCRI